METQKILQQILKQIDKKATIYTTDNFGMILKLEGKILDAEIAPYAQYEDGLKLTFKRKKCRKSEIIRAYRGWSSVGRDGITREHGTELVIVPGWDNELRVSDEVISTNKVTGVVVEKAHSLHFKTFPTIKERASAIKGSVVFSINP